ncbi:MAG: hypothetical protein H6713_02080 [Myxococcales bacterium]|nr:hypothetical protein [Myxococcales bacterium]
MSALAAPPCALLSLSALSLILLACTGEDAPSSLERRSQEQTTPSETPDPGESGEPAKEARPKLTPRPADPNATPESTKTPEDGSVLLVKNPDGERVQLRLRLKDDSVYRVMTIGNVQLPAVQTPTGFARQIELALKDCSGEGQDRRCTLEHRYLNYDAEPPTGTFMRQDEAQVADLVTRHTLFADGRYGGPTQVEGPKEQAEAPAGQALAVAERFFCIRLPAEPIAERASWKSRCRRRVGGKVDERELVYILKTLDVEPETGEQRAEIKYIGSYKTTDPKLGERSGAVTGTLFFWVTTGEPHVMTEKISLSINDERGLATQTTTKTQFSRLDPGPPEVLTRTDERPYQTPPVTLNKAAGHEYAGPKFNVELPEGDSTADVKADAKADAKAEDSKGVG